MSRISVLGELSGAIAHELNQPLTAILINARAALRKLVDLPADHDELNEILEDIVADDKRAGEVIRRLRALLVRGAVEMGPVDINHCIQEVLELEHGDLVARNVRTELRLEAGLPIVTGDRVQLQQVLLNLIVNARDAMASNAPDDRHLCVISEAHDAHVRIEVCDTGQGLEDVETIFEPFFSTKSESIGIGLSICRNIMTAHGGTLRARNSPPRGATFRMEIPVSSPAAGTPPVSGVA